jgi:hypothetical protein
MLNTLVTYRNGIGQALSAVAATATVVIFQSYFELSWYISIPAGALAYVSMPFLWTRILDYLALPTRR